MRPALGMAGLALLLAPPARPLRAQAPAASVATAAAPCSYRSCALGIAPVWNGLAVVRGTEGARLATLGFFRAGALDGVFTPGDSAAWYAARAVRARRVAAVLTDAGALALGYAAVRAAAGRGGAGARGAAVAGGAALAAGVPLQFAADGLLSRAVWWHNARYAR